MECLKQPRRNLAKTVRRIRGMATVTVFVTEEGRTESERKTKSDATEFTVLSQLLLTSSCSIHLIECLQKKQ